jgi:SAM-dependent methyltransferase
MSLAAGYFHQMYAVSPDPWGLATRWYEARKYAISLALLPERQYQDAFEPGCSIGVFSELLATRCRRLLSWDLSAAAVRSARKRTAARPNIQVALGRIPVDWPAGQFDLVVFSELLYYFAGAELDRVLALGTRCLRPGGTLLAVHWRHPVAEYPRSGDDVHQVLARRPGLARLVEHREPDFIAEVYQCGGARSVAQAEGLV